MINKTQITQQQNAISDLRELVAQAEDSPKKEQALAYCDGCLAACELGLDVLKAQSAKPKTEKPKADATEEPKKTAKKTTKKTTKKAEEPTVEEPPKEEPKKEEPATDDFDELL